MIATKIEQLYAGNVREVMLEADELRHALAGVGGNAPYAVAYLGEDVMAQAFRDYGVEGLRTQLVYVLVNLGRWQGEAARRWKAWLRARTGVA